MPTEINPEAVLEVLRQADTPLSTTAVTLRLGHTISSGRPGRNESLANAVLHELFEAGEVVRSGGFGGRTYEWEV